MPCTVHCLISEKEQLGPLMQRIARADTGDRVCSAAPRDGPRTPASVMSAIELAARRADRSTG